MLSNAKISELFSKYKNMIYRLAFSYCKSKDMADDILQDVFLRYIKKEPIFDNDEHEKAWFIRVTINCCKTSLTSSWMKKTTSLEDFQLPFEQREESDLFYAVMELPSKYRVVVHLFYYENYSTQEISQLLSISQSAVNTRLCRARKMLKESLSHKTTEIPLFQN